MTFAEYFTKDISWIQYVDYFLRIVVACLCGAAIGFERSRRSKSAGMRTHIIVCCAAALMMIVSKYGFMDLTTVAGFRLNETKIADPSRVASQVVSGISFLGAGVIFKHGSSIKGLTTAAGIWATAGIGLALGAGMYILGLFSTVIIAVLQLVMHKFKFAKESWADTRLVFKAANDKSFRDEFMKVLDTWKAQIEDISVTEDDDSFQYDVLVRIPEGFKLEDAISYFQEDNRISNYSIKTLQ